MKEYYDYSLKQDIDYIKEVKKLSHNELANFLSIGEATLYRWYKSPKNASFDSLNKLYNYAYSENLRINTIKSHIYQEGYEKKGYKVLFHGSKEGIFGSRIELKYSEKDNDFGIGFYCGEQIVQPETFVVNYKESSLYMFAFDYRKLKKIEFNVDTQWVLAIAYYRGYLEKYKNSKILKKLIEKVEKADYIIAPIADNMMFDHIRRFANGELSDIQCQHCLSATNLGKQYVLKSEKAIDSLKILDRSFICEKERKDLLKISNDNRIISENKVSYAISKYRKEGKSIEEILND